MDVLVQPVCSFWMDDVVIWGETAERLLAW